MAPIQAGHNPVAGWRTGTPVGSSGHHGRTAEDDMGIGSSLGKGIAPRLAKAAPELSSRFVHESLRRAIEGVGPPPPAAGDARRGTAAPELSCRFVHESLRRAIEGVGPLPPAAGNADRVLREAHGDVERA